MARKRTETAWAVTCRDLHYLSLHRRDAEDVCRNLDPEGARGRGWWCGPHRVIRVRVRF